MKAIKEFLEENVELGSINKILDVGFGRGEFTAMLLESIGKEREYVGIEVIDAAVESANENFKDEPVKVLKMDASNMEFEDNTFDMVCISNTLHHLENLSDVIEEMKRVVKPDGYLLIQEMVCDNQTEKQMTHVTLHHFSAKIDNYFGRYHGETYTRGQLDSLYSELGLSPYATTEYLMHELYPIEDERSVVENIVKSMRKGLERIDDAKIRQQLSDEFEGFANKIIETGFESATETLVLLQQTK
jgi:ubiquinone/menaquinone biosynthesis C-methylase UbiE